MKALGVIVASLVLWADFASAVIINKTVNGTAGPWNWVDGGLNTAYQYGAGYSAPTVVSEEDGITFYAGLSLTISYVSGQVDSVAGDGFWDANGNPNPPSIDDGIWAYAAPSYYMNHATYPIWRGELVGTFANNNGQIVGTPFAIGNLGTFTIPTGATRLQLGVNDTLHNDNLGSWTIQIAQVPEPSAFALALLGIAALIGSLRLRRRSS